MRNICIIAAVAALAIAGCGNSADEPNAAAAPSTTGTTAPVTSGSNELVAYELGSKKKGDKGVCVICNKKEGTTGEEEIAETIDYEGKTYLFCSESEKAEFISDPKKYVSAQ